MVPAYAVGLSGSPMNLTAASPMQACCGASAQASTFVDRTYAPTPFTHASSHPNTKPTTSKSTTAKPKSKSTTALSTATRPITPFAVATKP
ncbi:MAG: hypothetical protein WDW36_000089 [Sanguina aurantia]